MARNIESSGVTDSGSFGISFKDSAHIMTILRDTLYSDKILAVLREYASNAWDANREAGRGDVPIRVKVPTMEDPVLTISDDGPGLSNDDVFNVYSQYGASTKRGSDKVVGMLGIGSKSGFAYSDTFTIISKHGGMQRIYSALIDETEKGVIKLLDRTPCKGTGVTIQIPVDPKDLVRFNDKAKSLFKYFEPRPDINIPLPELPQDRTSLKHGWLSRDSNSQWTAVMGCVPYKVDMDHLDSKVADFIEKVSGVLRFDIGEVEINASREELKYSDKTIAALVKKLNDLGDEFVKQTIAAIEKQSITKWDKRLRAQILRVMGFPVPKGVLDDAAVAYIDVGHLISGKELFYIHTSKSREGAHRIFVDENSRILIGDDRRAIKGFHLGSRDYIITTKSRAKYPLKDLERDLPKILKDLDLEGIPTGKLSEQTWTEYRMGRRVSKTKDPKHHSKVFVLNTKTRHYGHPYSSAWNVESRTPSDDDVFVIIEYFKEKKLGTTFYSRVSTDLTIAEAFGVKMPPIYGYKSTKKHPVKPESCKGEHYSTWRKKFYKDLAKKFLDKLKLYEWSKILSGSYYRPSERNLKVVEKGLGKTHPLTRLLAKHLDAKKTISSMTRGRPRALSELYDIVHDRKKPFSNAEAENERAQSKYPLLGLLHQSGFSTFHRWKEKDPMTQELIRYIKLIDSDNRKRKKK